MKKWSRLMAAALQQIPHSLRFLESLEWGASPTVK
jgi:hypothetical protein